LPTTNYIYIYISWNAYILNYFLMICYYKAIVNIFEKCSIHSLLIMNSKTIIELINRFPLNKFANHLHTMSNCKSKRFNPGKRNQIHLLIVVKTILALFIRFNEIISIFMFIYSWSWHPMNWIHFIMLLESFVIHKY
jgi:hypothetical protein